MKEIIAVLGAGNGGHATAADLALAGFEVRLFELPGYLKDVEKVFDTREIKITGAARTGVAKLSMVTSDIKEAISGAKMIVIPLPAFTHHVYAELIADSLEDGQVIFLFPGTFGSLLFQNVFRKKNIKKNIIIAEANSLPYDARITGPGEVHVYGMNDPLQLGVFPAKFTDIGLEAARKMYLFNPAEDVVDCGLISMNPLAHTPGCILNAGRIERSRGEFWLYEEGVTPCVARVMEVLDNERLALVKKFGYKPISFVEAAAGDRQPRTIWEEINSSIKLTQIKGPTSIYNRYFTEDIPYGLVPWSRLGDLVGVETPIMDSLINIGSIIIQQDAWQVGRSLADYGIDGMTLEEMKRFLYEGKVN